MTKKFIKKLRRPRGWIVDKTLKTRYLRVDTNFLIKSTWETSPIYQQDRNIVSTLKVVNDFGKRSVALMTAYNTMPLTRHKEELQKGLQSVDDSRTKISNVKKENLNSVIRFSIFNPL
jgi:hypothetical protein